MLRWLNENRHIHGARPEQLQGHRDALDGLAELITGSEAIARAHSARRIEFMRQAKVNQREDGAHLYGSAAADGPDLGSPERTALNFNRRDAHGAEIFRWLADDYYAGRKLIVWAHNLHVMSAYVTADDSTFTLERQVGSKVPAGRILKEHFGDDVYTIGFTTYEGTRRLLSGAWENAPVEPAPAGSLEAELHELGPPHLFLDFRQLDDQPEHWLRRPGLMMIQDYLFAEIADTTRVYDAIFFNDTLTPSRRVE